MRKRIDYPMGSISSGTMRPEDLIPTFLDELEHLARLRNVGVPAKTRKAHAVLCREIDKHIDASQDGEYYESGPHGYADDDLESLTDALGEYAAPYFYFGSHPGDGADYGFWLSEDWDEDFITPERWEDSVYYAADCIKVSDLSEVPAKFRGEVAEVNDHDNVTLYVKTSRGLREIWSVV